MISSDDKNVNLLWTGGWDSTFQLLQLLTLYKIRVTPFYLIDENRESTGAEIRTMQRIKHRLFEKYPLTQGLLCPTQYFGVSDIVPDSEIENAYRAIRREKYMGGQYAWFSRFCKQHSIADMQLCIHRDDKARRVIENIVSEESDGAMRVFRARPKFGMTNEYVVFRYFSFPLFSLSKLQMAAIADDKGWKDEMDLTWFCHNPRKGMKPCGICNPCLYTIEEGFGWRLPASSRVWSFFYKAFIRPSKSVIKRVLIEIGLMERLRRRA